MRIFVTGASGFVGSAVVQELIRAGHQVTGLARSESSAQALTKAGARVHQGDLQNLDSLRTAAEKADGVIHTAFIHDFSNFKANCEIDRHAIDAIGSALAGSNRPFIITSGTALVKPGHLALETDRPESGPDAMPRIASEEAAHALNSRGVRVSVMRLPPSVHGDGDHGFVPTLIGIAREKGVSAYIGDGAHVWPAVHRLDAALLYRLIIENTSASGFFHAVGEQGIPTRTIAETIGRHLNLPVVGKSPTEAAEHFGWIGHFFGLNVPASSALTEKQMGWKPKNVGLIEDLEKGTYFKTE